ncbi:MAG: RNA-binding protein [Xanthobacteraceae bacterium]
MIVHTPHDRQMEELDRGPRGRERERLCVATRMVRPVGDLIRFVVGPDGDAIPDIKCKLPGRGVWVTGTHDAIENAIKHNCFARGFKRAIRLSADLAGKTERLLQQSALDALAMAAKAGRVGAGFAKTATLLERGEAVALIHAADGSSEGLGKLAAIIRRRGNGIIPVIEFLTSAQLDLALSRPNVVHAALLAGSASDAFLSRSRRLERYRTGGAGDRGNRADKSATH